MIARVRFPASWRDGAGGQHCGLADFRLGKGPCGLTVDTLSVRLAEGCLTIEQTHVDGPPKTFIYPLDQLTGRVEVEHVA